MVESVLVVEAAEDRLRQHAAALGGRLRPVNAPVVPGSSGMAKVPYQFLLDGAAPTAAARGRGSDATT